MVERRVGRVMGRKAGRVIEVQRGVEMIVEL